VAAAIKWSGNSWHERAGGSARLRSSDVVAGSGESREGEDDDDDGASSETTVLPLAAGAAAAFASAVAG
jgi:hypothetical protein